MSSLSEHIRCEQTHLVASYALAVLDRNETESMAAHLAVCTQCQQEYHGVSGLTAALSEWRDQELSLPTRLWSCLLERIADVPQARAAMPDAPASTPPSADSWPDPQWNEVVEGITCKLLSTDANADRVSMLVRLAPGISYPPHRHAGVEELFLLEGELWIDERKLLPGDYSRAEAGTSDQRVWSETGCMCLLITSTADELR